MTDITIVDGNSRAVPNAVVIVYHLGTSQLADIFDTNGNPLTNPVTADSQGCLSLCVTTTGQFTLSVFDPACMSTFTAEPITIEACGTPTTTNGASSMATTTHSNALLTDQSQMLLEALGALTPPDNCAGTQQTDVCLINLDGFIVALQRLFPDLTLPRDGGELTARVNTLADEIAGSSTPQILAEAILSDNNANAQFRAWLSTALDSMTPAQKLDFVQSLFSPEASNSLWYDSNNKIGENDANPGNFALVNTIV